MEKKENKKGFKVKQNLVLENTVGEQIEKSALRNGVSVPKSNLEGRRSKGCRIMEQEKSNKGSLVEWMQGPIPRSLMHKAKLKRRKKRSEEVINCPYLRGNVSTSTSDEIQRVGGSRDEGPLCLEAAKWVGSKKSDEL